MSAALPFDLALCLLLVGTAISAVAGRALFAAIAFFITYGILVALAWLRLDAVDVALAEAAIGAGLTGVLLIGAWFLIEQRFGARDEPPLPVWSRLGAALAAGFVTVMLILAMLALPGEEAGLNERVRGHLAESGLENPVTAVLLAFRAYDTLMESVVLLVALVAVWSLTPDALWGRSPGLAQHARPDGVLASFGRLLPPLGIIVGVYIVWAGSDMPGGAFQAGTVLAAVWLLAMMAGVTEAPRTSSFALRASLVAGPAVFLTAGLAGAFFGSFLGFPAASAKAMILGIEFALAFSIAATLALLVAGTPRHASR